MRRHDSLLVKTNRAVAQLPFGRLTAGGMKRVMKIVGLLSAACSLLVATSCSSGSPAAKTEKVGSVAEALTNWNNSPGWTQLGNVATGVAAVQRTGTSTLDVWTVGCPALPCTTPAIWRNSYTAPKWTGWALQNAGPTDSNGTGPVGSPAVLATATGAMIVVAGRASGLWWSNWTSSSNTFSAWQALPSFTFNLSSPAITAGNAGTYVWSPSAGTTVVYTIFNGTSWTAWTGIGGSGLPSSSISSPTAVRFATPTGEKQTVFINSGGQIYMKSIGDPHAAQWTSLSQPGGVALEWAPAIAVPPGLPSGTYGVDVFAHGTDGLIHVYNWRSTGPSLWNNIQVTPTGGSKATVVQNPMFAAVYRGTGYGQALDLLDIGSTWNMWWADAFTTPPTFTVAASAPDKHIIGVGDPMDPSGWTFETTSVAVPPKKADGSTGVCGSQGALFVNPGCYGTGSATYAWRYSGTGCIDGTGGTCTLSNATNLQTLATGTDQLTASCDNQTARMPDGTLLIVRQTARSGTTNIGACLPNVVEGTDYFLALSNCAGGNTWSVRSILHPGSFNGGKWCDGTGQAGFDRPEMHVDPFHNGRVYLAVSAGNGGTTAHDTALFWSNNMNTASPTWSLIGALFGGWTDWPTALPSGKLAIVRCAPPGLQFSTFDPSTGVLSADTQIAGDCGWVDGVRGGGTSAITRVGSYDRADVVRIVYPSVETQAGLVRQVAKMINVTIPNGGVLYVSSPTAVIRATSPQGSVLQVTSIDSDALEVGGNGEVNPSLVYWYETTNTPQPPSIDSSGFGTISVKGASVTTGDMLGASSVIVGPTLTLSQNVWSWPHMDDFATGDYQKGAFSYDPTARKSKFTAQWTSISRAPAPTRCTPAPWCRRGRDSIELQTEAHGYRKGVPRSVRAARARSQRGRWQAAHPDRRHRQWDVLNTTVTSLPRSFPATRSIFPSEFRSPSAIEAGCEPAA